MGQPEEGSLGSQAPAGWMPRSAYSVTLTVVESPAGDPEFRYSDPLFDSGSPLDLAVTEDCLVILECDRSKGLSWSLATDAISLKVSADSRFYFGLKNMDGATAYDRGEFPAGRSCTQICFGAQLNVDEPENDRHPFNLDVMLERNGQTLPIRIDPDIKNPST